MAPTGLKYLNKLQGQRVLVVGGSSGIGFGIAEAALEHGAIVTISSSNQTKLDAAVQRLKDHAKANNLSSNISGKTCDLANSEKIDENVKSLLEFATQGGKLDHVAFTAGDALKLTPLSDVTIDSLNKAGQVRVTGAIMIAKYLPQYINKDVNSSLTLTGGVSALRPRPNWTVFMAGAGGGDSMVRALAIDLHPVRVNGVSPGAVKTEIFDGFAKDKLDAILDVFANETLVGRVGTPEELAEAYLFFMKSTFSTGSIINVEGGKLVGDAQSLGGV